MRKSRQLSAGAEYHVTARINRGEKIFLPREGRDFFMSILKRAKKKFGFSVKNFCVMGNHIHLLIKPEGKESLSKIMQWLLGVFARAWNKKHCLSGHLWGDRFFSKIISGIFEYLRTFIYIDYNPVNAGMVMLPEEWMHGGLWHHKNGLTEIISPIEPDLTKFFPEHKISFNYNKIAEE